jgi:hypothetical protein
MPIETIPDELSSQPDMIKNWPQVLVYSTYGHFSVAHVRKDENGEYRATAFTDGLPAYDRRHYGPIEIYRPTHWMRLPPEPSDKRSDDRSVAWHPDRFSQEVSAQRPVKSVYEYACEYEFRHDSNHHDLSERDLLLIQDAIAGYLLEVEER